MAKTPTKAQIKDARDTLAAELADRRLGECMSEEGDDGPLRDMLLHGFAGYSNLPAAELVVLANELEDPDDEVLAAIQVLEVPGA